MAPPWMEQASALDQGPLHQPEPPRTAADKRSLDQRGGFHTTLNLADPSSGHAQSHQQQQQQSIRRRERSRTKSLASRINAEEKSRQSRQTVVDWQVSEHSTMHVHLPL